MSANRRLLAVIVVAPVAMFALAFASKPLYDTFCRVTGFGGTTRTASQAPVAVLDREIEIRFDSNVGPGTPVSFRPAQDRMRVRLGQTVLAYYELDNPTGEPVELIASYNVTPHKTGVYFQKLACFCFERTVYPPGDNQRLPILFYVDPKMDTSDRHDDVNSITLSYTFFEASPQS